MKLMVFSTLENHPQVLAEFMHYDVGSSETAVGKICCLLSPVKDEFWAHKKG